MSDQMDTSPDSVQLFKYNNALPDFIKQGIPAEMEEWKKQMIDGFEKVAKAEKKDWFILLASMRVFRRYVTTVHYPLTDHEREHICELLIPLLTHPETTLDIQTRIANILNKVIKRKYKLNITADWKPIYDLLQKHYFRKNRTLLYTPPDNHRRALVHLLYKLRTYFPSEIATNQVLDEIRPLLCPHDSVCSEAQGFLCLFLPTSPPRNEPNAGKPEWLDEILGVWEWVGNNPFWDLNFISLLRRLAEDRAGNIDWSPYLQVIFTRILRSLDLPVGSPPPPSTYNRYASNSNLFGEANEVKTQLMEQSGTLIINLISPQCPEALVYLKKLYKSIEQYYHPSNSGEWSDSLGTFIFTLCKRLARRLLHESETEVRQDYKLPDETTREFIDLLYPIAKMAMFSKSHRLSLCAIQSIKHLAYIKPDMVFPTLMESISHALQTLTETHQTSAAMELLSVVICPVLNKRKQFPQGKNYVHDLMNLALPGIDPNDYLKTLITSKFFMTLLSVLPLFTKATHDQHDGENPDGINFEADEVSTQAPLAVQFFEDWCIDYLSRVFQIYTHLGPQSENKKKRKISHDAFPTFALSGATKLLFQQLSPELHKLCVRKVIEHVSLEFVPNAAKQIGDLCQAAACYYDASSNKSSYDPLGMLINVLYKKLVDKNELQNLTDSESNYYLRILGKTVRQNYRVIDHKDALFKVIDLTIKSSSDKVAKPAGKLLKNVLQSLSMVYPLEHRSVSPKIWNSKEFETKHWKTWGQFVGLEGLDVQWHVPSQAEMQWATELYNHFVEEPMSIIKQYSETKSTSGLSNRELTRALLQLRALLRGASLLLEEMNVDVVEKYTKKQVRADFNAGIFSIPDSSVKYTRHDLAVALHNACQVLISTSVSDIKLLLTMVKANYALICYRQMSFSKMLDRFKQFAIMKRNLFKTYNKKQFYPRTLMIQIVHTQLAARVYLRTIPFCNIHEKLLQDLYTLSLSEFSKVRRKSQNIFVNSLKLFHVRTFSKFLLPAIHMLENQDATPDKINGAIYILQKPSIVRRINDDWELVSNFLLAICRSYHVDKPTVQARLNNLFVTYSVNFKELRLDWPHTKEETIQNHYQPLVNGLLHLLKQDIHWRYQLMVYTVLVLLIRSDYSVFFPIEGVKIFLKALTSDIVSIRTGAIKAISLILAQYKPNQPKRRIVHENTQRTTFEQKSIISHGKPLTKDDWEKADFQDKNYFGWNAKPRESMVYDYSKPRVFRPETQDLINETKSLVIEDSNWLGTFFNLMALQPRPNKFSFDDTTAQLFKGMFQTYGIAFLESCKPHLEKLLAHAGSQKPEERSNVALAAELIGGLGRGINHWPFDERQAAIDYILPQLKKALRECSQSCISDMQSCLRFLAYDLDIRRCVWLREFLIDNIDLESGTTASQSKSLSYLFPVLSEFSWRDKITLDQVTNKLLKYMAHPYQQVRDIIATNLTLPFRFTWNPTRDPTTQRPILSDRPLQPDSALSEFLNNAALEFERLKHEAYRVTQVGNGDSQVNDSTQPQPRVSKEEAALKSFSRTFTTWLQHLMIMGSSMAIIPYMDVLVPTLASIYADSNDVELQGMSGKTFITISSSLFPKSNVQQVMGLIMQIESAMALTSSVQEGSTLAATANWRVRLALLMFIQSFAFRHQFYLLDKEQEDMFYQQLMTLLKDRSVEVREQACTTLAGFIKIANDSKLAELVDHFEKASVNPLAPLKRKKKSTQPSSPAPSNTTKFDAHYAVLGLSALIRAYPYDVPEFLPRLMVRLADFQHYKTVKGGDDEVAVSAQVINETVRKTFSNFWRTHRDTWHIHKSKFDEDQLYVVTQLLVSPIYYA